METTINNAWGTLSKKKNGTTENDGVTIQRASAGLNTRWSAPNNEDKSIVEICSISYYQRELYPNGDVIKTELKTYVLEDLASLDVGENKEMLPLAVLSGFVANLGQPLIVDKILLTLMDDVILFIDAPSGYELHKLTREVVDKPVITE